MTDRETLRSLVRTDLPTFLGKVFETLNQGDSLDGNWHLEAIAYELEQVRLGYSNRLIVNVPPRSLKSTLCSVAFPAYVWGRHPTARIICVSYTQALASKLARDFRQVISSDWYRETFPDVSLAKETDEMLENNRGGARLSTSIGAAVTGFGGSIIIIDDPMKPEEGYSDLQRGRVRSYYRKTLYSRLDNKVTGKIILVMQRLHEDDLSGELLREGGWKSVVLPAIATADENIVLGQGRVHSRKIGDVLHLSREPLSVLEDMRRNLGGAEFESQYQQSPVPPSGNMVKAEWLKTYRQYPSGEDGKVTQSWDTAVKGDAKNDYSVCTTWLETRGAHYLLDVFREKLDFPDLVKAVVDQRARFSPNAILIEDQGSGSSLIQQIRDQHRIYSIPFRSKLDKATRLSIVLPMFERGQIHLPEDASWLPEFLKEALGFPRTKYDDQVDSLTQYLAWAGNRSSCSFEADFGITEAPTAAEIISYTRGLLW